MYIGWDLIKDKTYHTVCQPFVITPKRPKLCDNKNKISIIFYAIQCIKCVNILLVYGRIFGMKVNVEVNRPEE